MSPYKMSISERASPGTGVGALKATDEDWEENGLVTYRFLEANVGKIFRTMKRTFLLTPKMFELNAFLSSFTKVNFSDKCDPCT